MCQRYISTPSSPSPPNQHRGPTCKDKEAKHLRCGRFQGTVCHSSLFLQWNQRKDQVNSCAAVTELRSERGLGRKPGRGGSECCGSSVVPTQRFGVLSLAPISPGPKLPDHLPPETQVLQWAPHRDSTRADIDSLTSVTVSAFIILCCDNRIPRVG